MFDQFTSRIPIPQFLWAQMQVERETVNFVLGLFQFCPTPFCPLSGHYVPRLLNPAKG